MVVPQRKTLNLYEVLYNRTLLKGLIYLLGSRVSILFHLNPVNN